MKNTIQKDDDIIQYTAPTGGVVSGVPVVFNDLILVPLTTASEGELFAGSREGVYELRKASIAISFGKKAYWDATNKVATDIATNNKLLGFFVSDALAGDDVVQVCFP